MPQAQFIGGTPAEITQSSLNSFMAGMGQLAQFGQFATEQNRLNKVEKIKNTVNDFLLTAQRYGGGPGKEYLGIKEIAETRPDYYLNMLKTIEMDPKVAKEMVDFLATSPKNWEEGAKANLDSLYKIVGGKAPVEQVPAEMGATTTQVSQTTTAPSAGAAVPTPAAGEALNLNEWDKAYAGQLGTGDDAKQAQAAVTMAAGLATGQTYKDMLSKVGLQPEDHGEAGKPRLMYFTSGIADKLLASPNLTDEEKAQVLRDKKTYTDAVSTLDAVRSKAATTLPGYGNLTPEQQAAGPVHANLGQPASEQVVVTPAGSVAARGATAPATAGNSDEAFWNYMQNDPKIGPWKGMSYADAKASGRDKKLITANPAKYKAFMANQPAAAAAPAAPAGPTVPTTTAQATTTVTTPSAAVADKPVSSIKSASDAAAASNALAGTINPGISDKDRRLAQSYSAKLMKINTTAGERELAAANQEEALAYQRVQAQNEAVNHAIMMYIDPKGEIAYQRDVASGALEATITKMKADTAISLKQLELLPEQMSLSREKIKAEYARAEADLAVARTGVDIAKVHLQIALADKDRAVAMVDAAGLDAAYAPVKDASVAVNDAYGKYVDYMRSIPKDKDGKLKPDDSIVTDLNILVDNYNSQVSRMNQLARASSIPGWADVTVLPHVSLANVAWWEGVWGWLTGKSYPSGIVPVEGETSKSPAPAPAAAATPKKLTQSQIDEDMARKAAGLSSKYGTY